MDWENQVKTIKTKTSIRLPFTTLVIRGRKSKEIVRLPWKLKGRRRSKRKKKRLSNQADDSECAVTFIIKRILSYNA